LAVLALVAAWGVSGLLPAQSASAAERTARRSGPVTHWVDDDAPNSSGPGKCAKAVYDRIQKAVDAAKPGDKIMVCPGSYPENVTVLKDGLDIRSSNGNGITTVHAPAGAPGFYVRAKDVVIGRLTIQMVDDGDQGIGINVANEGETGLKLLEDRIIGGRIGVNLGCASHGSKVAHSKLYRQTQAGINVDTCEIAPFPGSRLNDIHHIEACSPTMNGSIAIGDSSNANHVHDNTVRTISLFGNDNVVNDNVTQSPIVDNGTNNVLSGNSTDPALCV
jgi:hypothetical protein